MKIKNINSWQKERPDPRDHLYGKQYKVGYFYRTKKIVDLRDKLSPVENQLESNSCSANAVVTSPEMYSNNDLSRLFLYYNGRKKSGLHTIDQGAYIRDVLKSAKEGICSENIWPFDLSKINEVPSKECYNKADYKINGYKKIIHSNKMIGEICHALDRQKIIIFGITLFGSFMALKQDRYEKPPFQERVIGYHAVNLVGYNKRNKHFLLRNSWGKIWGDGGYAFIPFNIITDRDWCDDFWVIE